MTEAPRNKLVFVVDDTEPSRLHAEALLRRQGWKVRGFADVATSIRALAEALPAAMVLDIRMPGASGLAYAARLRAHPRTAPIRLVGYTGIPSGEAALLRWAGFDDVVAKPAAAADFTRALPLG